MASTSPPASLVGTLIVLTLVSGLVDAVCYRGRRGRLAAPRGRLLVAVTGLGFAWSTARCDDGARE